MANKCDCYRKGERFEYNTVIMKGVMKPYDYCVGTKEQEECNCGGDRTQCNFYPEVRAKAMKERDPKFGEWISVEDRLPTYKDGKVLIYTAYGISIGEKTISNRWRGDKAIPKQITHWMPLPAPPTEKEN